MASRGGSAGARKGMQARARARAPAPPRGRRARAPPEPKRTSRLNLSNTPLRAFAARPHLSAALLLALVVFAYLWPALVGGRIFSPISALYIVAPWHNLDPHDLHDYFNDLLVDIPLTNYPIRVLVRELLHQGTLPVWNRHVFAGVPLYTNPQTGLFSPFNLPLWILPINYALGLSAALKLWVGGFGTYLLARQLRLGFLPGLLAGIAFAFCSLNIVWLAHETLPGVAVMLPWAVLLVERIFERGRLGSALGLAVVTAIGLGGGHPGMQVHLLAALALYVLLRAALSRELPLRRRAQILAYCGGALLTGVLLMAAMLVPEALSGRGTIGVAARARGGTLPGSSMPFDAIQTVLFPDWWGRPSAHEAGGIPGTSAAYVNYNERTFYVGVVAALFACIGLLARDGWRRKAPFAVFVVIGLAIPLHAPGFYWLATHLPVLDLVQSQRLHFLFEFGAAILAAYGLQAALERPAQERRWLLVPLGAATIGLVAIATAGASAADVGRVARHFLTGADSGRNGVLALTSVVWFLLFAAGAAGAILAVRRWPQHTVAIGTVVVALAVFDALHFAHGYQPMGPPSKVIPPRTPAIAYLQRHAHEGRLAGLNYAVPNDWSLIYGLDDIRGYDPPYPTSRYFRLWREANPNQADWMDFTMDALNTPVVKVTGVLGARFIAADPGVELPAHPEAGVRSLTRVYAGKDATIFMNRDAAPRALVPSDVVLTANEPATRAKLVEARFDPRRTAVVERGEPGAAALVAGPRARGTVAIVSEDDASVTLRARLDRRGLVVLNDDLTAGWGVRVDGRPAPLVRVNDVMRGVVVGPGRHEIVWSYRVPGLQLGIGLSLLGLVLVCGAGGCLTLRRWRRELT